MALRPRDAKEDKSLVERFLTLPRCEGCAFMVPRRYPRRNRGQHQVPLRKLNARFVATIRTDQARLKIRDEDEEGLELRVTRRGVKTWAFRYRRRSDSRKRLLTLGRYPTMSLEEARIRVQEERAKISRGADPAGGEQERKAAPTFRDIAEEWQSNYAEANRSERVRKDDQSVLCCHILPAIGDMKGSDIGRRELSKLLNGAKAATDRRKGHTRPGRKPRRLTHRPNRVFELTRAIFRWAVGQGILIADPTLGMKRPIRKEAPRERELSPDEIRVLWHVLDKTPTLRSQWKRQDGDLPMTRSIALAMKLALATGQRIGEVSGIALAELDLNDAAPIWTIPGERSKNNEAHRVPLSRIAVGLVHAAHKLSGASPWLFPSPKGQGPIAATKALGRARGVIGLANFRVHDLRRTAATRMGEMGIVPHTISLILNHVSVSKSTITSKVYLKYTYDREKREALSAWGNRLEEIVAGQMPVS
jgi:integrase